MKVDWKQRSTDGGDVRAAEKRVGKRWIDEGGDKPGCRNPGHTVTVSWEYINTTINLSYPRLGHSIDDSG